MRECLLLNFKYLFSLWIKVETARLYFMTFCCAQSLWRYDCATHITWWSEWQRWAMGPGKCLSLAAFKVWVFRTPTSQQGRKSSRPIVFRVDKLLCKTTEITYNYYDLHIHSISEGKYVSINMLHYWVVVLQQNSSDYFFRNKSQVCYLFISCIWSSPHRRYPWPETLLKSLTTTRQQLATPGGFASCQFYTGLPNPLVSCPQQP